MKLYNSTKSTLIADDTEVADTFAARTFGLIPKRDFFHGHALVIKPCCSIHTFFMKFNIDVLFVNKKNEVIALYENVKPWRILPIHFSSCYVIELPFRTISAKNIEKGDVIRVD